MFAQGIYGWLAHPIYAGFVLFAFGLSLTYGSASGLWLVCPCAALALVALVMGYEAHDLRRRFGDALRRPRLALPGAGDGVPGVWERISVYVFVLLPWALVQQVLPLVGVQAAGAVSYAPLTLPVTLALVFVTPLLVRRRAVLRCAAVTGLLALCATALVYLMAPGISLVHPTLWVLLVADVWRSIALPWGAVATAWAVLLAAGALGSGTATGGVFLAAVLFIIVRQYGALWQGLRRGAEWLANSWREWRLGPVRIISHGFYAGLAGALGFWIAGRLAGSGYLLPLMLVGVASLLGAMLWGQYVEGSPVLLRPLGWYGGLIGGLASVGLLRLWEVQVLPLLGALVVATPWIQAVGRLRCPVQGCCHGAWAPPEVGIRYYHPRSRVTCVAGWEGVPLHPTPLYSILANVVLGILLYRLWASGAPVGLAMGLYFIISGASRFVEESYRGEPQTPVAAGLGLYQWLALLSFAVGIPLTMVNVPPPAPAPASCGLWAGALVMGLVGWFVTGVDFPGSSRRFSRLASAD